MDYVDQIVLGDCEAVPAGLRVVQTNSQNFDLDNSLS